MNQSTHTSVRQEFQHRERTTCCEKHVRPFSELISPAEFHWWRQLSNPMYFRDNHSILVKYGQIPSNRLHFLPLGHLIGSLAYLFLGIRQAMPLSVTKTLAFPRMNSVAGVRFGIQFVQYGYLPGKFKLDTHKKCRRFFRCVYSCPKMRYILGICENQISGVHCFSSSLRKGYERWTTFSEMLDLGPMKSDHFFFLRLKGWSCQYPFSNHFYGRNPTWLTMTSLHYPLTAYKQDPSCIPSKSKTKERMVEWWWSM